MSSIKLAWANSSYGDELRVNKTYFAIFRHQFTKGNYNVFSVEGTSGNKLVNIFSDQIDLLNLVKDAPDGSVFAFHMVSLRSKLSTYQVSWDNIEYTVHTVHSACLIQSPSEGEVLKLRVGTHGMPFISSK